MKKSIFTLITIACLTSNAHAIWVYDSAAAVNAGKQILETKKQLEQMKAQVDQMKSIYQSFNGARNVVDLLKNPLILSKLPPTYQEFYNGIKNAKNDKWALLYKLSQDGKSDKLATDANLKQAYDKALLDYSNKVEQSFDDTSKRLKTLDDLTNKINQTKDPKEIADLQARIASEQAGIAIDKTRLDLLREVKTLKQEALQQQANNKWQESLKKPFTMPDIHVDLKK